MSAASFRIWPRASSRGWYLQALHKSALTSRLFQVQRALVGAETRLALLDSLTPTNWGSEVARLASSFKEGHFDLPQFRFVPETDRRKRSDSVSATLVAAQLALTDTGFQKELAPGLSELLHERILELLLEVQMVRECGRPELRTLTLARYRFESPAIEDARQLAMSWNEAPDHFEGEKEDLLLAAAFEEKRKAMGPFSERIIIVERNLASLCAVGGSHLYVQRGARASRKEVERLWVHEVEGHLLPRLQAQQEPPPFLIGTPGSSIDEEGRAVFLEEKYGLLHERRRRDLALRFLLALALREEGDEGVRKRLRLERERGVAEAILARAVCRVYRGGGLSREVIYLPGYLRVKATLEQSPSMNEYFRRGLVSVSALTFFQNHFPLAVRNR